MVEIKEILSKKSTDYLKTCLYDDSFVEYKRDIAYELIRRFSFFGVHVNKGLAYDCISYLSLNEAMEILKNENPCMCYIATCNIRDRLMDTKNGNYFNDGRIRARKKVKMKRKKVLSYED